MRARMATITYHAPYNQHTIATRNQGDNVSSMLPILGSGDDSCSALETACGHKRALRGHKPQPLTAKTHPPARPMAWCDRTRPPGLCPPARAGNLGLLAAAHSPPLGTRGSRAQLRAPCTTTAVPVRSRTLSVESPMGGHEDGVLTSQIGANSIGCRALRMVRNTYKYRRPVRAARAAASAGQHSGYQRSSHLARVPGQPAAPSAGPRSPHIWQRPRDCEALIVTETVDFMKMVMARVGSKIELEEE